MTASRRFGAAASAGLACIGLWMTLLPARSEEAKDAVRREVERLGSSSYEDREKATESLGKRLEELRERPDPAPFLEALKQLEDARKTTADAEIQQRLEPLLERFWPPEHLGNQVEERKRLASDPLIDPIPELPPGQRDPINAAVAIDGVARYSFRNGKTLYVAGTKKGDSRKTVKGGAPGSSWVASLDATTGSGRQRGMWKKEVRGEIIGLKAGDHKLIVESVDEESTKWITIFRLECDLPEREGKKPK